MNTTCHMKVKTPEVKSANELHSWRPTLFRPQSDSEEMVAEGRGPVISMRCKQPSDCSAAVCGECKTCICKDNLCGCKEDKFPPTLAFLGRHP